MKRFASLILAAGLIFGICSSAFAESKKDYVMRTKREGNKCRDNMAMIYNALSTYAEKHDGKLPARRNAAGLAELLQYDLPITALHCQAGKSKKIKKREEISARTVSYVYLNGINLKAAAAKLPNLPLVFDRPDSRHHCALLADGTVIEVNPKKYKLKISNCNEMLDVLDAMYKYPPDILKALRVEAKKIDQELQLK